MATEDLVFQVQQNNELAFKQLYQIYYPRVVFFITGIIKTHNIAQDLAQDVFVNIWINKKKLDPTLNLNNYIFVVSRNAAINYLKKEMLLLHSPIGPDDLDISVGNTIEDNFFAKEISLLIEMVVSEMPTQRQHIYRLSREKGLSNEDISNLLNISKKTVENQIGMALKDIKQAILTYIIFITYLLS